MAQVQLYAKRQDATSDYINLELFDSEPIKLTLSVTSIEDPLAATSIYSKTFRVPHTSINGPFFEGVFNVNSIDFDASKKADAYILDNGMLFTNGNIVLNGIYVNESTKNIEYEITFLGETSDFGAKIGGGFLSDLNLNQYNHDRTYQSITQSWTNGLYNGDVVYGLIEWGYNYNANNQPVQPTLSNGFEKSFTNSLNPLRIQQWKPQIRAKALWDTIFNESGYTYDSEFLSSPFFESMYVISDSAAQAELGTENTFQASNPVGITVPAGGSSLIYCPTITQDPGNNVRLVSDPVTNEFYNTYKAPSTGLYTFTFRCRILTDTRDGDDIFGSVLIFDADTQDYVGNKRFDVLNRQQLDVSINCQLQSGQTVYFICDITSIVRGGLGIDPTYAELINMRLFCTEAPTIMSIATMMPNNIRKIDYMRSIINRFRLVFVPSTDIANHFTITPWKDWILQGKSVDWSNKLDTSKDLKISPLFYGQSRFQVYKDEEDADYINYNYQLVYKQTVGQLNLDSNNELIKGEKIYQDKFAPTPIAPIGFKEGDIAASRFLIPHMAKDTGSSNDTVGTSVIVGKREPIQPKLRLVFYNGLQAAPIDWYMALTLSATTSQVQESYPLMSQYASWPVTSTTFDLNWENETPQWDATDTFLGNAETAFSSFNVYWKTWYDLMFDPYSRRVETSIVLDYNDVLDIKFNDYVFIKDAWYFVDKISDYIAGKNTNCKVDLIKLGNNIGITLPIVIPTSLTPIRLCVASNACDAFCCNPNVVNATPGEYFLNALLLINATALYADSQGTTFAPEGIYSNGILTFNVDGAGIITEFLDTTACVCTQTAYDYTTQYSNTACRACCGGSTVVVYSNNAVFTDGRFLYLDALFTIPAPIGYYSLAGEVVEVSNTGQILTIAQCDVCACTPLFDYYPCYDITICGVCCCPATPVVWGEASTWEANTILYSDNAGVTPAPEGFYKLNDTILTVNALGEVTSDAATCTACDPCPEGPIEVTVNLEQATAGYNSSATLQFSYNNFSWNNVGTVEILDTDPANTAVSTLFTVRDNVYLRTIFTSDVNQGILTTTYTINGTIVPDTALLTPASRTTVIPGKTILLSSYEFTGIVSGGIEPCEPNLIIGGLFSTYKGTGWPGGGIIRGIIALDNTGSIDTAFNVEGGFTKPSLVTGTIWDIKNWNEKLLISGQFINYKSIDVTDGLIILNRDGSVYEEFQTIVGAYSSTIATDAPSARSTEIDGDIAYIGGEFLYWNEATLGSTTPNYYTASPRMVAINLIDGSINKAFNAQFSTLDTADTEIEIIKLYENKLYVGGNLQSYNGNTAVKWLYRLNLDGTLDTTFNATALGNRVLDIYFMGDRMFVAGTFGLRKLVTATGAIDTTWNTGQAGFNGAVYSISLSGDYLYLTGSFTFYNGVRRQRIISINKNDATYNATFNIGTGLTSGLNDIGRNAIILNGYIYVTGLFTTYKTITANRIVKILLADGSIDPTFITGTGFNNQSGGIFYNECPPPTITTYLINTSFGSNTCNAWCETDTFPIYGNGTTLIQSTQLFSNIDGTAYPTIGYYSDGSTVVNVGANGIIIEVMNTNSCQCQTSNLYLFNTKYDATVICDALCTGVATIVYLNNPSVSLASIAYTNPLGTIPAPAGYYVYFQNVITIGANGVITSVTNIPYTCGCPTEECAIYEIRNLDANPISSTWVDCNGAPVAPTNTIPVGGAILTSCTLPSNISSTGNTSISYFGACTTPVTYFISLGSAECQIDGPCDSPESACEVQIPIIENCPIGSNVALTIVNSAYSLVDAFYDAGTTSWYVTFAQIPNPDPGIRTNYRSFADIRLDISNGGTLLATTSVRISYRATWEYLPACP